jgi:ABC-2 type transport system ATP-binding protein
LIEVESLSKRFGRTQAVSALTFAAKPGLVTGFLGPNGAGKSTTLRAVLGLVNQDAGTATVLGRPYRELDRPTERVGAVLEASSFHPGRTGRNHLRVLATAARLPRSRVEEVLAGGYSLGMRPRLGLGAALLGDPEALVLDEPANGLDPQGIRWLRDLLRTLATDGRTILVSSHVLAEVAQTVDEVVIIAHGQLVVQGTMDEVLARSTGGTRVRSPEADRLVGLLGGEARPLGDGSLIAAASPERVGEIAAANGVVLHELTRERATLEEVFLELTGEPGERGA